MNKGYELIYKKDNPDQFWTFFNLLKANFEFIGSIYDPITLDWFYMKAADFGYEVKDYSCIFTFDGIPFSSFLGAKIYKDGISSLSLYEAPCLAIDAVNISSKKKKQINAFGEILLEQKFDNFKIKGPDLESKMPILCEFLLNKTKSYINPVTTRVINLSLSKDDLKRTIRKSYHSLINWGLNTMKLEVHNSINIKWETIESFRTLHIREAKRETRSLQTWRKQFEAISNGLAFCITGKLNEEIISAAYFLCPDKICYYGSSASRRDLFDKPLGHAIIWEAILESKKRGVYFFNIGSTYEFKFNKLATCKEKNIAFFKEGFGGNLVMNYIIENRI